MARPLVKIAKKSPRAARPGRVETPRSRRPGRATVFARFVSEEPSAAVKVDVIRAGVRARVVDDMVEYLAVPKRTIFKLLRTPESTAHKLVKDDRTLDSAATERVVRVADITRMAEETFGGRAAATRWLSTANRALAGATPLSMLDTEPGAAEVRRLLSAIDYGGTF
jgi:putative toxin-antitoxin system antitoxin component (TIGR02293 family)